MPDNQKEREEILKSVALLVLDAQDCFIETLHDKESFLLRTAFAIEAARTLRIQTIFTEQAPDKLGRTNRALFNLAHRARVFPKRSFSAFGAEGLQSYLRNQEIYNVLICGLETPICVYQTGLQGAEEDIDMTFLTDALGARRAADESPTLDALRLLGCQCLPSETIFYSLLAEVSHPLFRAYNAVVKSYGTRRYQEADFFGAAHDRREPRDARESDSKETEEDRGTENAEREGAADEPRTHRRRSSRGRRGNRKSSEGGIDPRASQTSSNESREEASSDRPRDETAPSPSESREPISVEESPNATDENPVARKAPRKRAAKRATKKTARKRAVKKAAEAD